MTLQELRDTVRRIHNERAMRKIDAATGPHRTNSTMDPVRRQTEALRKNFARVPFQRCGNCDSATLYKAYNPTWVGFKLWCYTCGAKDDATKVKRDEVTYSPKVNKLTAEQVRLVQRWLTEQESDVVKSKQGGVPLI